MNEKVYPLSLFLKHRLVQIMLGISIISNMFTWGTLLFFVRKSDDQFFLHYNIFFGVDLIGDWIQIFFLPISGLFIYLLNTCIALFLFKKARGVSYLVLGVSSFLQICILGSAYLVILLNV